MSPGFAIVACLLIVVVLSVGGSLYAIWRDRRQRVKDPCCAACRYPVRGLQSFLCPECGLDLREAGILTSSLRPARPPGPLLQVAAWTFGLAVLAMVVTGLLGAVPGIHQTVITRRLVFTSPAGLFTQLSLDSSVRRVGAEHRDLRIELNVAPPSAGAALLGGGGRESSLVLHAGHSAPWTSTTFTGVVTRGAAPFQRADLIAWIEQAGAADGVTIDTPPEHAEIDDIMGTIQDVRKAPESNPLAYTRLVARTNAVSVQSSAAPWFLPASGAFWGATWIIGLCFIRRAAKARRKKPRPATTQAAEA